jgi:hypothetical protein
MHCVVQKSFNGNGIDYQSNWLVDTTGWNPRRRNQLITQNYMRIASEEEISSADTEEESSSPRQSSRTRKKKKVSVRR